MNDNDLQKWWESGFYTKMALIPPPRLSRRTRVWYWLLPHLPYRLKWWYLTREVQQPGFWTERMDAFPRLKDLL